MDFSNRAAIVTGGVGVIGFETCVQLAAAGANVVINGRKPGRCEEAAARLRALSPEAGIEPIAADVSDYSECQRLVAESEAAFGRVDMAIHCALSPLPGLEGLFEGTDPGPVRCSHAAGDLCAHVPRARGDSRAAACGAIVAFPLDSGKVAAPNQSIVGTTRAAVMMFMRSLALEVSGDAIRCNCIAPTYVDTPALREAMTTGPHADRYAKATARAKLGLPTPAELAALAIFLCSPSAAHLTGQVISVNGGLSAA